MTHRTLGLLLVVGVIVLIAVAIATGEQQSHEWERRAYGPAPDRDPRSLHPAQVGVRPLVAVDAAGLGGRAHAGRASLGPGSRPDLADVALADRDIGIPIAMLPVLLVFLSIGLVWFIDLGAAVAAAQRKD